MTSRDTYDIEQYELEKLQSELSNLNAEEKRVVQANIPVVYATEICFDTNEYYSDLLDHIKNVQRYGV